MDTLVLSNKLRYCAATIALIGTTTGAQAVTICAGDCLNRPSTGQVAIAAPPVAPIFGLGVIEAMPQQTESGWNYSFSAFNTLSPVNVITLPYFADFRIDSIVSPLGWTFEIGTTDLFGLGQGASFMQWSYAGTPPSDVYPIFGFVSSFSPGLAPFKLASTDLSTFGSSGHIPISPTAILAGLSVDPVAVPLPPSFGIFLAGLIGIASRHSPNRMP